jgi:hypothetical protein
MGPTAGLGTVAKRNIRTLAGNRAPFVRLNKDATDEWNTWFVREKQENTTKVVV